MNRWTVLFATLLMTALIALSCSSGSGSPTAPAADPNLTGSSSHVGQAQTHLWGYYDVYFDVENQTVDAVLNRQCMFTANVTTFVNGSTSNLAFNIYGTPATADYVDVDIDVSITHPFPGMTEYNGYDVKGVFMGPGSSTMKYSTKCKYAKYGTDQSLWDFNPDGDDPAYTDPYAGDGAVGNPDGYTRWFNAKEFIFPGIMGYTQGKLATPGYQAMLTATVNPYKYYADDLAANDDLWTWLNANPDSDGVFSAGTKNTRNYYLRFPNANGVKYGYAVVASWKGEAPEDHPANAPEAAAVKVDVEPNIFYVDATNKGGDLILDVNLWGWDYQPTLIKVESTVLGAVHSLDVTEMTPTGGDENYSVYHCEIPADNIKGTEGNEFWVIAEYGDFDYMSDFTPIGGAPVAKLAAFFRWNLFVANEPYNADPVCDLEVVTAMPHVGNGQIQFDASASTDPDGDPLTFAWDFNDDGTFGGAEDTYTGTPDKPTHAYAADYVGQVCVKVTDGLGGEAICCVDVDVTLCLETAYACGAGTSVGYDSAYELTTGYSTAAGDDGCAYSIAIPFTFSFGGGNYSSLNIELNGGVNFGSCYGWYPYACGLNIGSPYIWALMADMYSSSAPIRYGSKSVNGINCFIIDWENCPLYYYGGAYTFQIVLMDGCQTTNDPWRVQWKNLTNAGSYQAGFYSTSTGGCCITYGAQQNTAYQYGWVP